MSVVNFLSCLALSRSVLVVSIASACALSVNAHADEFRMTIMHTNDTHSHHEAQGRSGDGGAARQASVVKDIRAEVDNSLLLDAGDRFTGTLFHKYYAGEDNVKVMNALGYDAMALGNHEFDNGLEVLERFVTGVDFPVLSANTDFGTLETLASAVPGSAVLDVGGEKVGVIGLVTAETPEITINFSNKDQITWSANYATAVNRETAKLKADGVNKIILITHIGLGLDKEVAANTTDIDVIVGGHSHTVISSIFKEGGDTEYPLEVENADGDPVYIVQAGDRDRYLGRLNLRFDDDGLVTRARGDLILLSKHIKPDPAVQAMVDELARPIEELRNTVVALEDGTAVVSNQLMTNKTCRAGECLIGNLLTDAMRDETGSDIAITNGGGIRADIDEGEVTVGEVLTVLPFGNTVATLKLTGAQIAASLEHGVGRVGGKGGTGRFPQVSGLRYEFDSTSAPGSRLKRVEVGDSSGGYAPIDEGKMYTVATNNFMRTGGDGYEIFEKDAQEPYDYGRPLEEALMDYMIKKHPVAVVKDGRILGQ